MSYKSFQRRIDNYKDTIFAIIGFINLIRFDDNTRKFRDDIKICQGRRLRTSSSNLITPNDDVTPDICIQSPDNKGLIAEIKKTFPKDKTLWLEDLKQLKKYDDKLDNWFFGNNPDEHEIVLLPDQSRSRDFINFYNNHSELQLQHNFVIVEFVRAESGGSIYFFFRKEYGDFIYFNLNQRLHNGVMVPFEKLMLNYEKIKLYDSMPPMPYLLELIWENIIVRKISSDEKFTTLRKRSKLS